MNVDLLADREILVCVGSGGVGKTTTAAAIALEAARRGKKTLVLTIDPAKRLASAMGLSELGNQAARIPESALQRAGLEPEGELWGMMLDMKRTWDELIARIAPTPEKRDRILNNKYYRTLSSALAGSQEYMAMEKLQEIHAAGEYELIVVDTPPTKHALDFLEAPRRMSDFLEGRVIQVFLKPYLLAGKTTFRLLQRGTAGMMSVLEKVTGMEMMKDLADFFLSFEGLYDGFKERALRVSQLLRSRRTAFVLVAAPAALILRESADFADKLVEFGMPLAGVLFNRVHPSYLTTPRAERQVERLLRDAGRRREVLGEEGEAVVASLLAAFLRAQKLADADAANIERFVARYPALPTRRVPIFDDDIHDLAGLARMGEALFDEK
jgi:anion-transporting  ArsA/GET3 family ATPase